ncbi:hypothetical protein FJV41_24735 [Myxococcus llanfairpwllgwyngyllgogerychwyrndrobwllllantysiliogogogochensis]|uniref:Uncharacterized protein n=1 Tax=Myxococcus llanfairpwllgwyngyllgogerychwyrndrobwllllantysiliogogogochensis TaxID=2590453 RepID=A0A540WW75_9BACT|nr:hypothetical protein [Myxococcus llanfairpwllgwyngyllgogerychwyrndrobwllllantysiliogogogochensis]TQF13268.1 hypothetical protein FJV41_24735 [Myxococcus llanfairpwllgwyngyllgogerychwyrndrobwllllantysiliogogogochensis]
MRAPPAWHLSLWCCVLVLLQVGCGAATVNLRDWGSLHVTADDDTTGAFLPDDMQVDTGQAEGERPDSYCASRTDTACENAGMRPPLRRGPGARQWRRAPLLTPTPTPQQSQLQAHRLANHQVVQQARQRYAQRLKEAQARYPSSTGFQEHHLIPMYLGGAKSGATYRLPTAYHKAITQAFRERWTYGQERPPPEKLQLLLVQVYSQYPIPQLIGLQP